MEAVFVILAMFTAFSVIGSPFIAISAHRRIRRLETDVADLKRDAGPTEAEEFRAKPETPPAPVPKQSPKEPAPSKTEEEPDVSRSPEPEMPVHENPVTESPEESPWYRRSPRPLAKEGAISRRNDSGDTGDEPPVEKDGERTFATRWLVWLGGITITLGGIFLVKYSLDHGLIPPAVRIALGLLLSAVLVAGGEWIRRRPLEKDLPHLKASFVPQALTGSGLCIAFGSIYAGYGLFGLFSPGIAFIALAAIAIMALGLSLLQGPFVACLGVLAAFAVPLLVQTETHSVLGLFGYLSVIAAAGLAIFRYKDWWWLAGLSVACSVGWQLITLPHLAAMSDFLTLAANAVFVFLMTVFARFQTIDESTDGSGLPFDLPTMSNVHRLILASAVTVVVVMLFVLQRAEFANFALALAGGVVVLFEALSRRVRLLDDLPLLGAILALIALTAWIVPDQSAFAGLNLLESESQQSIDGIPYSAEFIRYGLVGFLAAGWFGITGYLKIGGSKRPDIWAAVSAFVPIAVFAVVYLRLSSLLPDLAWTLAALAIGAAAVFAAGLKEKRRLQPHMEQVLGLYALAALSAIGFALTMMLETAWLTVSLSIMLAVCAWVHDRFSIVYLRPAAAVVAVYVLVRLVLLHQIPGFEPNVALDAVTILYSYGLPAVFFAVAARMFRKSKNDYLVSILDSGVIAIPVTMVNLEIRHLVGPGVLDTERLTLLELSLHSMTWLASGIGLYYRNMRQPSAVKKWAYSVLLCLSAASVVVGQALLLNPWITGDAIGSLPVFNVMLLAYIVPAAAVSVLAILAYRNSDEILTRASAALAAGLVFLWLNLEVRHLFHDGSLKAGPMSDPELYTYSVAWLVFAIPVLVTGLLKQIRMVRYAGLGLILLVVAKVFIVDMSGLDGLYRAMSFLGLGFSLVGIGYFYQRYLK